MADVFLSYKSDDRPIAKVIAEALEAEGISVWWDPALHSGQDYQDVIDNNLREAGVVVVLWSPRSVKSRWVRSEATIGDRKGVLIPVTIEPCDRPVAFELLHTADLIAWRGDRQAPQWRAFVTDLGAKLDAQAAKGSAARPLESMMASELEALFWSSIKDSDDVTDFQSYLGRYPNGHFVDLARSRIGRGGGRSPVRRYGSAVAGVLGAVIAGLIGFVLLRGGAERTQSGAPPGQDAPPRIGPTNATVPTVPSDNLLDFWFAGSPHGADMPSETVSRRIVDMARSLGYTIRTRGLAAKEFLPELLKALDAGRAPDVIFVENYMHVSGGQTAQGTFSGMQSDERLRGRLLSVTESLDDLGRGWSFLVGKSPDHEGAVALVAELSGCETPLALPESQAARTLQLQAERAARAFASCSIDPSIYDKDALVQACASRPVTIRRVSVCGITMVGKLAWLETRAVLAGEREVGRRSIVTVHRDAGGWRVLTASGDPVSVGALGSWKGLAAKPPLSVGASTAAALETPDGVVPAPVGGARFGSFTWRPGAGMAQIVEMSYASDVRLFVLPPTERQLSAGRLWTTNGAWRWRVWTVGSDGALAFSEARSFNH